MSMITHTQKKLFCINVTWQSAGKMNDGINIQEDMFTLPQSFPTWTDSGFQLLEFSDQDEHCWAFGELVHSSGGQTLWGKHPYFIPMQEAARKRFLHLEKKHI